MNVFLYSLYMSALILLLTLLLAWAPTLTKNTVLGVRVPQNQLVHPAVQGSIKKYRLLTISSGLFSLVITLICWQKVMVSIFASLLPVFASYIFYTLLRRQLLSVKAEEGWFEGIETSISGSISQAKSHTLLANFSAPRFPWFSMSAALLITLATALYIIMRWESIPDKFATHFNENMVPDAWESKSITSVLMVSFISLGIWVLIALCAAFLSYAPVHQRSDRSIAGAVRTAASISASNKGSGILTLLLSIGLAVLQLATVLPDFWHLNNLGFWLVMGGSFVGIIIFVLLLVAELYKVNNLLEQVDLPDSTIESPDNDGLYKLGVFYYNPADPAVLVEKRFGVGMDFNYATWQAKVFVISIVLIVIGSIVLLSLVA